ncbi:class I SAM-dependent methyltransferase [Arthrobacter agilis]|uniref:class I SAM-dependent methyltransferase n=1 Tax=Arthrobacter agilis TaxID=37921 RepID=UPI000B36476B|nr:class I SAM-dependent methyltransferase [Arthrobacter agilis]OUM42278.1 methyltransferase type 12 [Arthrobacter agilis]PPB45620.1 class I SAM-dependent methyltransferase [Arthrobacter agilis]TPV26399.1 class I SAM-dependent methyltransferase [Arthrobacter agilis]VDR33708.1 Uncharacterised protein [Arthrobacter agilis]
MRSFVDQLRMVPEVARLASGTPRNTTDAWERYWASVRTTGTQGEVLWDADIGAEAEQYAGVLEERMDGALPIVDVGCGNGQWTRWLVGRFPAAVGVDVADSAVLRARAESLGVAGVSYRTLDLTSPGTGGRLHGEFGDANVFIRGVFHVLRPKQRAQLAANALDLVGARGRVLLTETNYRGTPLAYMQSLGASPGRIPEPLRRAIGNIPVPGHFGAAERRAAFPARAWSTLAEGRVSIEAVPMRGTAATAIPGYFAMLGAR